MTTPSPFQRILGAAFDKLPPPVRRFHGLGAPLLTSGRAEITAAGSPLAWLVSRIAGLPRPGKDVPVTVHFLPDGQGRELWKRRFPGRRYESLMMAGEGPNAGFLFERFGPFRLTFRLTPREDGLEWSLARWRLWALPLPRWTTPAIECLESGDGERFVFDIDVAFPIVGHVVHYRGWLEAAPGGQT